MMKAINNKGVVAPSEESAPAPNQPVPGKRGRPPRRANLWRPRFPDVLDSMVAAHTQSLQEGGAASATKGSSVDESVSLKLNADAVMEDSPGLRRLQCRILWPADHVLSTPEVPDVHIRHSVKLKRLFSRTGMNEDVTKLRQLLEIPRAEAVEELRKQLLIPIGGGMGADDDLAASNLLCLLKREAQCYF